MDCRFVRVYFAVLAYYSYILPLKLCSNIVCIYGTLVTSTAVSNNKGPTGPPLQLYHGGNTVPLHWTPLVVAPETKQAVFRHIGHRRAQQLDKVARERAKLLRKEEKNQKMERAGLELLELEEEVKQQQVVLDKLVQAKHETFMQFKATLMKETEMRKQVEEVKKKEADAFAMQKPEPAPPRTVDAETLRRIQEMHSAKPDCATPTLGQVLSSLNSGLSNAQIAAHGGNSALTNAIAQALQNSVQQQGQGQEIQPMLNQQHMQNSQSQQYMQSNTASQHAQQNQNFAQQQFMGRSTQGNQLQLTNTQIRVGTPQQGQMQPGHSTISTYQGNQMMVGKQLPMGMVEIKQEPGTFCTTPQPGQMPQYQVGVPPPPPPSQNMAGNLLGAIHGSLNMQGNVSGGFQPNLSSSMASNIQSSSGGLSGKFTPSLPSSVTPQVPTIQGNFQGNHGNMQQMGHGQLGAQLFAPLQGQGNPANNLQLPGGSNPPSRLATPQPQTYGQLVAQQQAREQKLYSRQGANQTQPTTEASNHGKPYTSYLGKTYNNRWK